MAVLAHGAPSLSRLSLNGLPAITPQGLLHLTALRQLHSVSVAWCAQPVQAASAALACHVLGHRLGPLMTVPPGKLEPVRLPPAATTSTSSSLTSSSSEEGFDGAAGSVAAVVGALDAGCSPLSPGPFGAVHGGGGGGSYSGTPTRSSRAAVGGAAVATAPVEVPGWLRSAASATAYVGPLCTCCSEGGGGAGACVAAGACGRGGAAVLRRAGGMQAHHSASLPGRGQTGSSSAAGQAAAASALSPQTPRSSEGAAALRLRNSPQCVGFVPLSDPAPRHAAACWWLPS